jgi:5-methyltetrahydrofolate--homocysteine methyltransferase
MGQAADNNILAGRGVRVALDVGPLGAMLEPCGELTAREASEIFDELAAAGVAAGAELVMFETFLDLAMLRVAVRAARRHGVPVLASMTFQQSGRTMMGDSAATSPRRSRRAARTPWAQLLPRSGGALPILRQFAAATELPLIFKPTPPAGDRPGRQDRPPLHAERSPESAPRWSSRPTSAPLRQRRGDIRELKKLL